MSGRCGLKFTAMIYFKGSQSWASRPYLGIEVSAVIFFQYVPAAFTVDSKIQGELLGDVWPLKPWFSVPHVAELEGFVLMVGKRISQGQENTSCSSQLLASWKLGAMCSFISTVCFYLTWKHYGGCVDQLLFLFSFLKGNESFEHSLLSLWFTLNLIETDTILIYCCAPPRVSSADVAGEDLVTLSGWAKQWMAAKVLVMYQHTQKGSGLPILI